MIEIRPIWNRVIDAEAQPKAEVSALLTVERRILDATETYLALSRTVWDEDYVNELISLLKSAHNDLIGGCEMARTGYLKQAYSLWRSWFEQSIFFLYFLEAPLHKAAWNVKEAISQDDNPQYRLMLHQLLAESGEKHPFALVYESRYAMVTDALKLSGIPKSQRPITRATKVLTTLSQGVHGTYQPTPAQDLDRLCVQLASHCTPVLESAEQVVNVFWILLLTNGLALPEATLIKLREGTIAVEDLRAAEVSSPEDVAKLAPLFTRAFPSLEKK